MVDDVIHQIHFHLHEQFVVETSCTKAEKLLMVELKKL
jgi:hypothetical protein